MLGLLMRWDYVQYATTMCGYCFVPECYSREEHDPNLLCWKCDVPLGPAHSECLASVAAYDKQRREDGYV